MRKPNTIRWTKQEMSAIAREMAGFGRRVFVVEDVRKAEKILATERRREVSGKQELKAFEAVLKKEIPGAFFSRSLPHDLSPYRLNGEKSAPVPAAVPHPAPPFPPVMTEMPPLPEPPPPPVAPEHGFEVTIKVKTSGAFAGLLGRLGALADAVGEFILTYPITGQKPAPPKLEAPKPAPVAPAAPAAPPLPSLSKFCFLIAGVGGHQVQTFMDHPDIMPLRARGMRAFFHTGGGIPELRNATHVIYLTDTPPVTAQYLRTAFQQPERLRRVDDMRGAVARVVEFTKQPL